MITTGFSHDGEAGDVVYFQTRRGTLCRVAFDGDGQAHISCSTDGLDDDKRTPSGAMPLVFDGYVLVNAPTIDESAGSTVLDPDHDASNGACNVFDAETLELVGSVPAREIESTPTLVDGSAVYLGEGGIYRIGLDEFTGRIRPGISRCLLRTVQRMWCRAIPTGKTCMPSRSGSVQANSRESLPVILRVHCE